jgi:uncharacterized damage-inducible protein DinB
MNKQMLQSLIRHQAWADAEHWKALEANPAALEDASIRKRLNHMVQTCEMLQTLARGEMPDFAAMNDRESAADLRAAMEKATAGLAAAIDSLDLDKMIQLPRGPKGPFEAPAGTLLLQIVMHGQHHRGQNASRMHELGVKPPMTDFIFWYALGQP